MRPSAIVWWRRRAASQCEEAFIGPMTSEAETPALGRVDSRSPATRRATPVRREPLQDDARTGPDRADDVPVSLRAGRPTSRFVMEHTRRSDFPGSTRTIKTDGYVARSSRSMTTVYVLARGVLRQALTERLQPEVGTLRGNSPIPDVAPIRPRMSTERVCSLGGYTALDIRL
jgi:hypothetical protein